MSRGLIPIAILLAIAVSAPASAQQSRSRTANDYVCILSGQCTSEGVPVREERQPIDPARQGFRLANPEEEEAKPPPSGNRFAIAAPRADLRLSFASGSATLTRSAIAEARKIATALKSPVLARKRFRIEGHTDSVGSRAYNLRLSQRRADAVVNYLASQGVSRRRLDAKGYGFDRPISGRPASAPQNRRVEAVAIP